MHCPGMIFYFDHRDGEAFYPDEDGLEFETVELARLEATRALADAARDALPGAERRELAIEVFDVDRTPLFRTALRFEVQSLSAS